ncbi:maltokinase N-terminal cap-like domain-containing protein [Nostocoides vanveenii]|uniref:Maltokinase n=1 Tax=Nostocoides vanveenii TaxID=330835 RepID=A0ABN2K4B6_9MICO
MALLHKGASISPAKKDAIAAWIGSQRWYAAKGRTPALRPLFAWRLDDPEGEVGIETFVIADDATSPPIVYQVPLTYRGAPLGGADAALVGVVEHSVLGTRYVYDAPHDPVYAAQLFALAIGEVEAASSSITDAVEPAVNGIGMGTRGWRLTESRVLSGEQSNTSIIGMAVDADGEPQPVIIKVFRALADGRNPDVELQGVLAAAGSTRVPASLGAVAGSWPEAGKPGRKAAPDAGVATGHLAFAQEFLPGAQDAWREALVAAGHGTDFAAGARTLGDATAEVHSLLAERLPTEPADPDRVAETIAEMRSRAAAAVAEAPQLASRADAIDAVYDAAAQADWPAFQRIHGDYHLGQVLHVPERGWVLLDFEGEPLRPLAERTRTDQPLRDVAGMLRSFDYAGGSVEQSTRGHSARDWVENAQQAFMDGYAARAGHDPRDAQALLFAYLVDKALYEVVYEVRNRPDWIGIPLTALDRLLPDAGQTKEDQP